VYDNKGWYLHNHCDKFGVCTDTAMVAAYGHVVLVPVGPTAYTAAGTTVTQPCSGVSFLTITNRFVHEPDGTAHHLVPDPASAGGTTCWGNLNATARADDGSGWAVNYSGLVLSSIADKSAKTITFPTSSCPTGGIDTITKDSNGNQITQRPCDTFANDTLGRPFYPTSYYDSSGTLQNVAVTSTTSVPIHTNLCTVSTADFCNEYASTWILPQIITLPNGMTYTFNYIQNKYGQPSSVTLPTGGQISWTWSTTPAVDGPRCTSRTETNAGQSYTWNYAFNSITSASTTDPAGNQTRITSARFKPSLSDWYWTAITNLGSPYVTKMEYFQGSIASGQLFKTIDTAYTTTGGVLPIRETTTWNQQNLVAKTETDWDGVTTWGGQVSIRNPIEKREFAYGTGTFGALQRRTHFNYLHLTNSTYLTKNILNLPTSKIVYDGASTIKAQATYTYDGTSLTSTSSTPAPNHDYTNFGSAFLTRGNLTRSSQWLGTTGTWLNTDNAYDDLGNRLLTTDPGLHSTAFSYTDSWKDTACTVGANTSAYLTQTTDALGHRVQNSYYRCMGLIGSTKDENNIANSGTGTTFTYDLMNRPLTVSFPDGGSMVKSYVDTGSISITSSQLVTTGLNVVKTNVFDGLGRISQTQLHDPSCGGGTGLVKVDDAYGFGSAGRVTQVSTPYCNTPDTTYGLMTTTNYDALDRVTSMVQADGSTISTTYSGTTGGLTATVTDEAGKSRKSQTDALGRLTAVWEDPSSLSYETDYAYDTLDDLTSVTQKAGAASGSWRTRTFTYDSLLRLKCAANPEVTSGLNVQATCPATDTGTYTAGTVGYSYDGDGNLLTKTAPAPNQTGTASTVVTNYSYDTVHRLTQKSYTGTPATPTVKYGYDGAALGGCGTAPPSISPADANPVNYRTSMCEGSGASSWSHDPMGRTLTQQEIINGSSAINNAVKYAYYKDGELNTLTYPSGRIVTYTANNGGGYSAGRPVSAADTGNSINYATSASYTPHGAIASFKLGASINGALAYNSRLQPMQMFYGTNTAPALTGISCPATIGNIMHRTYDFHLGAGDNGNVWAIANCRDTNRSQNFAYDNLNRINQAYTSGPNWGETFTVDGWGNLTNKGPVTGKTNYENFNAAPASIRNQLNGYCHDSAGNLVLNSTCPTGTFTPTYSYDIENRLVGTGGFTYVYDGDGKRVKKCSNAGCTTGTLYWMGMGNDPLQESDFAGNATEDYIFFNGTRVARRDSSGGAVHYYVADHLGSTDVVTSSAGAIQKESDYYPYAGEIVISGSDINNYKFASKERDSESNLDYFGARHYANAYGRFMQPDPISVSVPRAAMADNPQRWNAYKYGVNNPLRFTDVDGRFDSPVHTWLTQESGLNKGYSQGTVRLMIQANLNVDRISNQLNNHEHGMSDAFESKAQAAQQVNKVMENAKNQAVSDALKGDFAGSAKSLGAGLHTVQDLDAHQLGSLATHGRESPNDKDPQKVSNAEKDSENFLKSFDSAILKALGPEKGEEVLNSVRHAGDDKLSDGGIQKEEQTKGNCGDNCKQEPK